MEIDIESNDVYIECTVEEFALIYGAIMSTPTKRMKIRALTLIGVGNISNGAAIKLEKELRDKVEKIDDEQMLGWNSSAKGIDGSIVLRTDDIDA